MSIWICEKHGDEIVINYSSETEGCCPICEDLDEKGGTIEELEEKIKELEDQTEELKDRLNHEEELSDKLLGTSDK